jgi:hypothetical protein
MQTQTSSRAPGALPNSKPAIHEFVTDADVSALNAALGQHDLGPEQIAAIHFVPGTKLGNSPGNQYRVLYWA